MKLTSSSSSNFLHSFSKHQNLLVGLVVASESLCYAYGTAIVVIWRGECLAHFNVGRGERLSLVDIQGMGAYNRFKEKWRVGACKGVSVCLGHYINNPVGNCKPLFECVDVHC